MAQSKLVPPMLRGYLSAVERINVAPTNIENENGYYGLIFNDDGGSGAGWIDTPNMSSTTVEITAGSSEFIQFSSVDVPEDGRIAFLNNAGDVFESRPVMPNSTLTFSVNPTCVRISIPSVITAGNIRLYSTQQTTQEITDDIMNWDELNVRQERDGFTGVFVSIQQALAVCRNAKRFLHNIFMDAKLNSQILFEVYLRGKRDFNHTKIHSMDLDMSSYKEYKDYIEIEGSARNFNTLIANRGKTNYDIPVKDLATETWEYHHQQMIANGDWTLPESEIDTSSYNGFSLRPTMSLNAAEQPLGGIENDIKSQSYKIDSGLQNLIDDFFFQSAWLDWDNATEPQSIHISGSFTFDVRGINVASGNAVRNAGRWFIRKVNLNGDNMPVTFVWIYDVDSASGSDLQPIDINIDIDVAVNKGDKLLLGYTDNGTGATTILYKFQITQFDRFNISYPDQSQHVDNIPVVTPEVLGNALLAKMGEGKKTYTCEVDWKPDADGVSQRPYDVMLCAAESIRGFDDDTNPNTAAYFHTKLDDFLDFMQFLGYEWDVDEDSAILRFASRETYFNPDITALELSEREVSDLIIKANNKYAFSNINIGYEKEDIESVNGRLEPNGLFEYTTDYLAPDGKPSNLDLKSPYRADGIGIEVLSWTRGEKTTDNKEDKDIFAVAVNPSTTGIRTEYRGMQMVSKYSDIYSISIYNAPLNPYILLQEQTGRAGIAATLATFASTTGAREFSFDTLVDNPFSDVSLAGGLFAPIEYEVEVGTHRDLPTPELQSGLVKFTWQGVQYQGYIREILKNYSRTQGATWMLYAKL